MRKAFLAGGAFALALGLVGFVQAGDDVRDKGDMKANPGTLEGSVVKLYKSEKLVEFKIEKIVSTGERTSPPATPKDDTRKVDEKRADMPKEGEIIFLHVEDARIFDESGKELKREDKSAWFSRDSGWGALKDGLRLRVDYTGTHMLPAPKEFPTGARAGGNILVYHVDTIHILGKS
jgi:hypothetical protein